MYAKFFFDQISLWGVGRGGLSESGWETNDLLWKELFVESSLNLVGTECASRWARTRKIQGLN
jgi:hypothetical protein